MNLLRHLGSALGGVGIPSGRMLLQFPLLVCFYNLSARPFCIPVFPIPHRQKVPGNKEAQFQQTCVRVIAFCLSLTRTEYGWWPLQSVPLVSAPRVMLTLKQQGYLYVTNMLLWGFMYFSQQRM